MGRTRFYHPLILGKQTSEATNFLYSWRFRKPGLNSTDVLAFSLHNLHTAIDIGKTGYDGVKVQCTWKTPYLERLF